MGPVNDLQPTEWSLHFANSRQAPMVRSSQVPTSPTHSEVPRWVHLATRTARLLRRSGLISSRTILLSTLLAFLSVVALFV